MVELKKKVTLRTKTTEAPEEVQKPQVALKKKQPEPAPVPPTPPTPDGGGESNGKWKKYAAVLAGLVVLGGGGYYLSQQGNDTDDMQPIAEVVEGQKTDAAATDGTTSNQDGQSQGSDATASDAINESPAGDAPSVGGGSPVGDAPSNASASAPEQKNEGVASNAAETKDSAPKADTSTKGSPSKTVDQPKAGYTPASASSCASGTIEEEAKEVIRGKYGNGDVRKRNLGGRYAEIQSKVNEMYRNGLVN